MTLGTRFVSIRISCSDICVHKKLWSKFGSYTWLPHRVDPITDTHRFLCFILLLSYYQWPMWLFHSVSEVIFVNAGKTIGTLWQQTKNSETDVHAALTHCFDCRMVVTEPFNSLAPGRSQFHFKKVIFKLTLVNDGWGISYEIALRWMSQDLTDDLSTLVQVMAWCRQVPSHNLSQCWPRSMSPNGVTRPQGVRENVIVSMVRHFTSIRLINIDWSMMISYVSRKFHSNIYTLRNNVAPVFHGFTMVIQWQIKYKIHTLCTTSAALLKLLFAIILQT